MSVCDHRDYGAVWTHDDLEVAHDMGDVAIFLEDPLRVLDHILNIAGWDIPTVPSSSRYWNASECRA
jgi:hypothetical protein